MEKFSTHYLNKFKDNRGFFYESFSRDLSKQMEKSFVQDNISFS
ncbi:MAG TPA: hypothetical protein DCX27_22320, partial [Balneola sp.]|nr:hypothetical protein [Balneola sp.]